MDEISTDQLKAVAAILKLPMYRSKVALTEEILDKLKRYKRALEKEITKKQIGKPTRRKSRRSVSKKRGSLSRKKGRKSISKKRRSISRKKGRKSISKKRRSISRKKGRKSISKRRGSLSRKKGRKSISKRRGSLSRKKGRKSISKRGGRKSIGSRKSREQDVNKEAYKGAISRIAGQGYREVVSALANPQTGKLWILMRKPNSTRPSDRATIWGNVSGGPRHLYGGSTLTDKEFIESKLRKGYGKAPGLLRLARIASKK